MKQKTLKSSAEKDSTLGNYKGDICNMEGKDVKAKFQTAELSLKIYSLLWDTLLLILAVCKTVIIKPMVAFYGLW